MKFEEWLHQDEGFGPRIDRMMDDVKVSVEQEQTDDIIKWLMAAYAMGHEQGYDVGYHDANEDWKEQEDF